MSAALLVALLNLRDEMGFCHGFGASLAVETGGDGALLVGVDEHPGAWSDGWFPERTVVLRGLRAALERLP